MHRWTLSAVVIALSFAAPSAARAQGYFVPNIGYDVGGSAGNCPSLLHDCAEKKLSYGVTFGDLGAGIIGIEEDISYAPDFFGKSAGFGTNSVLTAMSNLVLSIPAGRVRPYVTGGIGLVRTRLDLVTTLSSESFTSNNLGYNLGAGVMVLLPHHVGFRGEVRYLRTASDLTIAGIALSNTTLNFTRLTVGLVIH
jgi:opacity protein-like surface antigen